MEVKRRTFNVMEALLIAAIIGLGVMIFNMRDAIVALTLTTANQTAEISSLRKDFAGVPEISNRVSRLEVQHEAQDLRDNAQDEAIKELRQTRGLR